MVRSPVGMSPSTNSVAPRSVHARQEALTAPLVRCRTFGVNAAATSRFADDFQSDTSLSICSSPCPNTPDRDAQGRDVRAFHERAIRCPVRICIDLNTDDRRRT